MADARETESIKIRQLLEAILEKTTASIWNPTPKRKKASVKKSENYKKHFVPHTTHQAKTTSKTGTQKKNIK